MTISLLILIPIIVQISIINNTFNVKKLSFIATIAINDYFLSGLDVYCEKYLKNNNKEKKIIVQNLKKNRETRRTSLAYMIKKDGYKITDQKVKHELLQKIQDVPGQSLKLFTDLILINSRQPAYYLSTNNSNKSQLFRSITAEQSGFIRSLNIISLFSFLVIYLSSLKKTNHLPSGFVAVNLTTSSVILFTYISNGVTYWQGDRLLVPIYYISLVWFFYQINTIAILFFRKPSPSVTSQ